MTTYIRKRIGATFHSLEPCTASFIIQTIGLGEKTSGCSNVVALLMLFGWQLEERQTMPSLNWFSLSRVGGGPTYYWAHNRTEAPVWLNDVFYGVFVSVAGLVAIMAVLAPPMKHKRNTLFLVTTESFEGTKRASSSLKKDPALRRPEKTKVRVDITFVRTIVA